MLECSSGVEIHLVERVDVQSLLMMLVEPAELVDALTLATKPFGGEPLA